MKLKKYLCVFDFFFSFSFFVKNRFSFSFQLQVFSEVPCTSGLFILTLGGLWQEQAGTWEPQITLHKDTDSEIQNYFSSCCSLCDVCWRLMRPQLTGAVRRNGEKLHQCSGCSAVWKAWKKKVLSLIIGSEEKAGMCCGLPPGRHGRWLTTFKLFFHRAVWTAREDWSCTGGCCITDLAFSRALQKKKNES